jgi:hypothetical protein
MDIDIQSGSSDSGHFALVCVGLRWFALVCVGLRWFALVCVGWFLLIICKDYCQFSMLSSIFRTYLV